MMEKTRVFFLVENTLMFDKNAYVFHVKKVVKLNKNGAFFTVLRHEEPMGAPKSKKKKLILKVYWIKYLHYLNVIFYVYS